jgi:flavin-dependent dehydrogenase
MGLLGFRGLEVVLLEAASFPRRKVCGSGLSPWTLDLLDDLGVGAQVRQEAYPIRAALIGGKRGECIALRSHYEAAVLLRARFDTLLAHAAARRHARLQEGTRVASVVRENGRLIGVKTTQGDIETDAVIVCNGANSRLARRPRPGQTLHSIMGWYEGVEGISDAVELYFDAVVKPYYGWVFPESPTRVNIGICYAPAPGGLTARERFEAFLASRLTPRLRSATRLGRLVGHPIATTYWPTALQPGMLVAGEAGGLVDPATAEGIHHALASGLLAGQYLGRILTQGRPASVQHLSPYTSLVRKRLGRRLLAGQCFVHLARTPVLDLALRFGARQSVQSLLTWALTGA